MTEKRHIDKGLLLLLCGIILMSSLPLFMKGIFFGHDLTFHIMRIEGLADEFRYGHIPPKLSSLWIWGYGYPVSIYYGDILLWPFALLRVIGLQAITVYKLYAFFINAGTAVIAYCCFQKIFKRRDISVVMSFAYVATGYRAMDIYSRAALGEYSAMMFLPVVALAVYRIYIADRDDWKGCGKNALLLALGMTGLIETHILTTEMVIFTLILICIFLWKKTFRKAVIGTYCLAAVETIIFNLYFIIPFLDYYFNVDTNINNTIENVVQHRQCHGAYIGQYFALFQSIFGISEVDLSVRMNLTPGPVLMAALIAGVALWVYRKSNREMKIFTLFSAGMLFMASNLFPWDYLADHFKVGKLLEQVQFPWRYIGIAILFLTLLLGCILKSLDTIWEPERVKRLCMLAAGACVFMSLFYVSDYSNNAETMIYDFDTSTYMYNAIGDEYIRYGTNYFTLSHELASENMQEVSVISRAGYTMELYCRTGDAAGFVEAPVFNYKGYHVTDEYGNSYEITDGVNNVIRFSLPAGFSGKVTIDFREPWYWRAGELASVLAFAGVCAHRLIRTRKSKSDGGHLPPVTTGV